MLGWIWTAALALAAGSLACMLVLVARRAWADRRRAKRREREAATVRLLMDWLDGKATDEAAASAVRRRPAEALGLMLDISHLVRGDAVARLAGLAREAGAGRWALRRLRRGRAKGRITAARFLGFLNLSGAEPGSEVALLDGLSDRFPKVRLAAAEALCELDRLPPAETLASRMRLDEFSPSLTLLGLLLRLAERRPDEVRALLGLPVAPRVRAYAMEALASTGDYRLLESFVAEASSAEVDARVAALRALGAMAHPAARPAVAAGLADPSWEVRVQAAHAVGRIGLTDLAPELERALDDDAWWVRYRSAEALWRLGPAGQSVLHRERERPDRVGRIAQAILSEKAA